MPSSRPELLPYRLQHLLIALPCARACMACLLALVFLLGVASLVLAGNPAGDISTPVIEQANDPFDDPAMDGQEGRDGNETESDGHALAGMFAAVESYGREVLSAISAAGTTRARFPGYYGQAPPLQF